MELLVLPRQRHFLGLGHIGGDFDDLFYNVNIVHIHIIHFVEHLQHSACDGATDKAGHAGTLHFVVERNFGVVHIAAGGMDVGAAHVAFRAVEEDGFYAVQSLVQGLCHPVGPVAGEEFAVDGVCVQTVVHKDNGVALFLIKAEHMDPLIQLADGMVDVGVVNGRTGKGRAVFHFVATDVGDSFRRPAGDVTHFGGLYIVQCQLHAVCDPVTDKFPIGGDHLIHFFIVGVGTDSRTGVAVGAS